MEETKKKLLNKILISIIVLVSILCISSMANAVTVQTKVDVAKMMSGPMPEMNIGGRTGMFPQYYLSSAGRKVTLDDSRTTFTTPKWDAKADGKIVYCATFGGFVRNGAYEDDVFYLHKDGITFQKNRKPVTIIPSGPTVESELALADQSAYNSIIIAINGKEYYTSPPDSGDRAPSKDKLHLVGRTVTLPPGAKLTDIGYIVRDSDDYAKNMAQSNAQDAMIKLFNKLGKDVKPVHYSKDVQDEGGLRDTTPGPIKGPEVMSIEQSEHANNGYAQKGTQSFSNDARAFIFTTSEEAYGAGPYASRYDLNDIQTAYWKYLQKYEGGKDPSARSTENGNKLFNEAEAYKELVPQLSSYTASINDAGAQVIVDRDAKKYIVGPYTLTYPYSSSNIDISYVKSITINDQLIYDEKHPNNDQFTVVIDGQGAKKSNGMYETYEYPKPGQKFFVVFSAEALNYPTSVDLNARFEYISKTEANEVITLGAKANVYQYEGYIEIGGEYSMAMGSVKYTYAYPETWKTEQVADGEESDGNGGMQTRYITKYYNYEEETKKDITFNIYMPYIKMNETPTATFQAQNLTVVGQATREYKVNKQTRHIDLTMELGGYTWVDVDGGKEDKSNGLYNSKDGDIRISNMPVKLRGKLLNGASTNEAETKTNNNGEYRFKGLNAMGMYSITFTYNGEYYQPTDYAKSDTWGKSQWKINSNAQDNKKEREDFNLGFKVIGANHGTYAENVNPTNDGVAQTSINEQIANNNNKSYTRDELEKAGVIDKFGNVNQGASNASMKNFANDCLMKAYTINSYNDGISKSYLYPVPSLFVIDDKAVPGGYLSILSKVLKGSPKILYPDAYYINLGLDQREQVDLAVKKDVDHVTLEINGQTHTYTYDSLENIIQEDGSWLVGVRPSDLQAIDREKYARNESGNVTIPTNYANADDGTYSANDANYKKNIYNGQEPTSYVRKLYREDYLYSVGYYGTPDIYGKTEEDELNVYITYKIMVRNQSLSIRARVDELVDYYDEDLTYVDERSYIEIKTSRDNAAQKGFYSPKASTESIYNNDKSSIEGYEKIYVRGLAQLSANENENYLAAGQTAYVYLTFKVNKDNDKRVILDEDLKTGNLEGYGVGKENIVEINGYATQYPKGAKVPNIGLVEFKPAGFIDRDSNAGNVTDVIKNKDIPNGDDLLSKLEDDTGKAPNIRIRLYRDDDQARTVTGIVFEDERTETINEQHTTTGNGKYNKDDKGNDKTVNGVTVQLVELMDNGTEFVWREFGANGAFGAVQEANDSNNYSTKGGSGNPNNGEKENAIINIVFDDGSKLVDDIVTGKNNGSYAFKSFMPGKYIIRFIYGDTVKTVLPSGLSINGLTPSMNEKSYNGQDFKSTSYQVGVDQNANAAERHSDYWKNMNDRLVYEWRKRIQNEQSQFQFVNKKYENGKWVYIYKNKQTREYFNAEHEIFDNIDVLLTQVSTFKTDYSNNETVALPNMTAENWEPIRVDAQNGYLYDIKTMEKYDNVSSAKDIMTDNNDSVAPSRPSQKLNSRQDVNKYSNNEGNGVTNYIAEVLASHKTDYDMENLSNNDRRALLKELMMKTQMTAETGLMVIELEYDTTKVDTKIGEEQAIQGKYQINNVNFGLEERPKAQLAIDKKVINAKLTLADGSILFDAQDTAQNLLWKHHKDYDDMYDGNFIKKFDNMAKIRELNADKIGLIQMTMDEELMHGAQLEATYEIKVKNIGEVDYFEILNGENIQDRGFYYTGKKSNSAKVVETSADQVIDYVANNLRFNEATNRANEWKVIGKEIVESDNPTTTLVNARLKDEVDSYNYIIETGTLGSKLVPEIADKDKSSAKTPLLLTQSITAENDLDDLTYRNIIEIVKTSNTVGRRMEYSVVGNQNPINDPQELDSDKAEIIRILPPFGNVVNYYMIAAIAVIAIGIIVIGIIFIKKKVLTK